MKEEPLLVNCQHLVWVGNDPSQQDAVHNWRVVRTWTIDHNNQDERIALGKFCQQAFRRGERVHTWAHVQGS